MKNVLIVSFGNTENEAYLLAKQTDTETGLFEIGE